MSANAYSSNAYRRVEVQTASQGKLIIMLCNGMIKYAEEAKRHMQSEDPAKTHNSLVRAQDIVVELRSALNVQAGEVADNLDRSYEYLHHLLIQANVKKEPGPIDECVVLMTMLRDAWEELFGKLSKEDTSDSVPVINQHGESVMNLEG